MVWILILHFQCEWEGSPSRTEALLLNLKLLSGVSISAHCASLPGWPV